MKTTIRKIKKLIIIADTNDADYITLVKDLGDELSKDDKAVIYALKIVGTVYGDGEDDIEIKKEIWNKIKDEEKERILTEWERGNGLIAYNRYSEDWKLDFISDYIPYLDNHPIHTIKSIEIIDCNNINKIK